MTNPRDDLAGLIHRACGCDGTCPPDEEDGRIADAIITAGWRAPGTTFEVCGHGRRMDQVCIGCERVPGGSFWGDR